MERKLYRSQRNRVFLGVCAGIGEYFKIDPVIIRVIAVLLIIPGVFPAIIAYFILALIIPVEGSSANTPQDSFRENVDDIRDTSANLGEEIRTTFSRKETKPESPDKVHPIAPPTEAHTTSNRALYVLGLIIIVIGVFFILVNVFHWFWQYLWPVLLIIVGVLIVFLVARRK